MSANLPTSQDCRPPFEQRFLTYFHCADFVATMHFGAPSHFVIAWLRRSFRGDRNLIQPDPAVTGASDRQKAQAEAL